MSFPTPPKQPSLDEVCKAKRLANDARDAVIAASTILELPRRRTVTVWRCVFQSDKYYTVYGDNEAQCVKAMLGKKLLYSELITKHK